MDAVLEGAVGPEAADPNPEALGARGVERQAASDPLVEALTEATPAPSVALPTAESPAESVPPVGDLVAEPIAERFFSEGDLGAAHADEDDAWHHAHDKVKRKSLPHVVERRERFARYVRWAVGGAALVCAAALVRSALLPVAVANPRAALALSAPEPAAVQPVVSPQPPPEPPKVEEAKAEAPKAEAPQVEAPKPEEAKADAPKPEEAKADAPKPEEAKTEAPKPPPPSDKTALQERENARRSLERGKVGDAIEAGERSVALDPQDGEAWLLLGAAYQEKGKSVEARRCYTSCVKEGKRGPLGECRAMLR